MPARGLFSKKRKAFLESKRAEFTTAFKDGYTADGLSIIIRQYFKRFPIDMSDDEEPSDEVLTAIDDNAPDPDLEEPNEDLSPDKHAAAQRAVLDRQARIQIKRDQITRWFGYRYMTASKVNPRSDKPDNPYNSLLLQITGNSSGSKPHRKAPVNLWVRNDSSTAPIRAEIQRLVNGQVVEQKKMVAIRSEAARTTFSLLSDEEKEIWKQRADQQHKEAMDEYERICNGEISSKPEDMQKCISGLVRFFQPILDNVALATGFKFMLIRGGPEPEQGGQLNVLSMYSGTNGGDVPLTFGQAERASFKKVILPLFGRYLRSCFTPEECQRRALPAGLPENSLESLATEDKGAFFHLFGLPDGAMSSPPTNNQEVPTKPATSTSDHVNAEPASTSPAEPANMSAPGGIAGVTHAIRSIERSVAESVARSVADSLSPTSSACVSPTPSAVPSLNPTPVASPQHTGTTSAKRARTLSATTPSKRPRMSDLAPASTIPPLDAPAWVSSAVDMFVSEPFDGKWMELVAAWLVYEGRRNFDGKKLSLKGRPKIVADWIKWACKSTWRPPTFPKADDFDREHTAWWKSLQPTWRVTEDGVLSRCGEGGWDTICVGSVNGLLSVLASLYFWRLAINDSSGNTESWMTIVDDTLYVIQQLTSTL